LGNLGCEILSKRSKSCQKPAKQFVFIEKVEKRVLICYKTIFFQLSDVEYNPSIVLNYRNKMAFMGQDGWKSSLSAQQQIKVTELEKQKEILKKELDKRTMIHDLLQQTFDKEKRHVDEEKSNTTTIKKELLAIQEKLGGLEKRNDKLQHDLLAKETQNISLQVRFF
jgi:hypothetical protein